MPIFKEEKVLVEIPFSGFSTESCHLDFTHKMMRGDRKGYPAFQHNGNFQMLEGAREEHVGYLIDGVFKRGSVVPEYRLTETECAIYKDPSDEYCQSYAEVFFRKMIGMMGISLFSHADAINTNDISNINVSLGKDKENSYISARVPADLLSIIKNGVDRNFKSAMKDYVGYKYKNTEKDISNDYESWSKDIHSLSSLQWKGIIDVFMMFSVMRYWQESIGYSMFLKNEMPIDKV